MCGNNEGTMEWIFDVDFLESKKSSRCGMNGGLRFGN